MIKGAFIIEERKNAFENSGKYPVVDHRPNPAGSTPIHVAEVRGRGLFNPPPVTTMRPAMIAAAGASTAPGKAPTTRQVSTLGSYSKRSPTTLRGGCDALHRPPTIKIRP